MRYKKKMISNYQFLNTKEEMINLTPLIDVVFVVLISFMIIAPMMEIEKISLAPAGNFNEKSIKKADSFEVYVKNDNTIWVNNKKISEQQLKQIAKNFVKIKKKPVIFHDEKATFGLYQKIKNIFESLGYEEMEVVLTPYEK